MCSICREVLNDPTILLCGHSICSAHVDQFVGNKTCPVCREPIDKKDLRSSFEFNSITSTINEITARCALAKGTCRNCVSEIRRYPMVSAAWSPAEIIPD